MIVGLLLFCTSSSAADIIITYSPEVPTHEDFITIEVEITDSNISTNISQINLTYECIYRNGTINLSQNGTFFNFTLYPFPPNTRINITISVIYEDGRVIKNDTVIYTNALLDIKWHNDLHYALSLSKNLNRTVLLFLTTKWSEDSRRMEEEVFTDENVINESADFVCVRVNGDENFDILKRYNVGLLPSVVFIYPNGTVHHKFAQYVTPEKMVEHMKGAKIEKEVKEDERKIPEVSNEIYASIGIFALCIISLYLLLKKKSEEK